MSFLSKKIWSKISTIITNEYRFYVDFKGMLYFEDSKEYIFPNSIKDKKFINQFYENLVPTKSFLESKKIDTNESNDSKIKHESLQAEIKRNQSYPYMAQFWGERNYMKYGIAPIIFNSIISKKSIPQIELNDDYENADFLQFSFGQYSLFEAKKILIDEEGKLWHPYIRLSNKKSKKTSQQQAQIKILPQTDILGVFSNQLIAQMLDQITYQNGQAFLSFKGQKYKINKKTNDSQESQKIFDYN